MRRPDRQRGHETLDNGSADRKTSPSRTCSPITVGSIAPPYAGTSHFTTLLHCGHHLPRRLGGDVVRVDPIPIGEVRPRVQPLLSPLPGRAHRPLSRVERLNRAAIAAAERADTSGNKLFTLWRRHVIITNSTLTTVAADKGVIR